MVIYYWVTYRLNFYLPLWSDVSVTWLNKLSVAWLNNFHFHLHQVLTSVIVWRCGSCRWQWRCETSFLVTAVVCSHSGVSWYCFELAHYCTVHWLAQMSDSFESLWTVGDSSISVNIKTFFVVWVWVSTGLLTNNLGKTDSETGACVTHPTTTECWLEHCSHCALATETHMSSREVLEIARGAHPRGKWHMLHHENFRSGNHLTFCSAQCAGQ